MIIDRMENQKQLNLKSEGLDQLNALFTNPQIDKIRQFFCNKDNYLSEIELRSDKSFLDRVDKTIALCKIKTLQLMLEYSETINDKQLKYLRNRLKHLNQPAVMLIKEGIITMYSEITEVKDKQSKEENSQFTKLLGKVLEILSPLLKDYFIMKQMERKDVNKSSHSLKQILSDSKIENNSRNSLTSINSAQSIKDFLANQLNVIQITKSIEAKSIEQLINHQLRGQQNEIQDVLQTCRICKRQLKMKYLENHIRNCTKHQAYISRREDILTEQMQIVSKIKQIIENTTDHIQESVDLIQKEQQKCSKQLMKMYKKIVQSFEGAPKLQRRNSMNGAKSKMKIRKRLSIEIEEFLENTNDNELLRNFKLYSKQRELLEKKISSLQNNSLNEWKQSENSDRSEKNLSSYRISIKSVKTSKMVSVKTKKSLFARKQNSSSSLSDSKIDEDKCNSVNVTKLMSIKAHMDEIVDGSDSDPDSLNFEDKTRLCKSLSNFHNKNEQESHEICIRDFDVIKFLGKGAFGKVYMVRRKKTLDIYALKVIKIQSNWSQKQLDSIKNEHQILSQIAGEYLVKAPFSFTEGSAHFFVLEYMPGGDLAKIIEKQVYLDERESQFYLAQIVLAIQRLHEMGIIHRDLKPENLIFDEYGHLKLTDFGLSQIRINDKIRKVRKLNSKTEQSEQQNNNEGGESQQKKCKAKIPEVNNTTKIVGTPDYIAPEIINGESLDNLSIDWWSLGVIAYQMMVGCRPFCAKTVDDVISNIENFNIEWPQIGDQQDMISPVAADFIKKLLNPNFKQRLGAKDIDQIKSHEFFTGVSWGQIRKSKPPLMPQVDRKQQYEYVPEISELKLEIVNAMGNGQSKSSFKLDNFVRYDILAEETLQSADKKIVKKQARIKKLRSIASNFGNLSGENNQKVDSNYGSKGVLDDEIEQCWKNFKND